MKKESELEEVSCQEKLSRKYQTRKSQVMVADMNSGF